MPTKKPTLGILTVTDMIVEELKKQIIDGEIRPGTQLKNTQLAEDFGTSITPIREALGKLQSLDLVEYKPRCGWRVKELGRNEIEQTYDIRKMLETSTVEKICLSSEDYDFTSLEDICAAYEKYTERKDSDGCYKMDLQFHSELVSYMNNKYADEMMDRIRNPMYLILSMESNKDKQNHQKSAEAHRELIECLKKKDLNAAMAILGDHVRPCMFDDEL